MGEDGLELARQRLRPVSDGAGAQAHDEIAGPHQRRHLPCQLLRVRHVFDVPMAALAHALDQGLGADTFKMYYTYYYAGGGFYRRRYDELVRDYNPVFSGDVIEERQM